MCKGGLRYQARQTESGDNPILSGKRGFTAVLAATLGAAAANFRDASELENCEIVRKKVAQL